MNQLNFETSNTLPHFSFHLKKALGHVTDVPVNYTRSRFMTREAPGSLHLLPQKLYIQLANRFVPIEVEEGLQK